MHIVGNTFPGIQGKLCKSLGDLLLVSSGCKSLMDIFLVISGYIYWVISWDMLFVIRDIIGY